MNRFAEMVIYLFYNVMMEIIIIMMDVQQHAKFNSFMYAQDTNPHIAALINQF